MKHSYLGVPYERLGTPFPRKAEKGNPELGETEGHSIRWGGVLKKPLFVCHDGGGKLIDFFLFRHVSSYYPEGPSTS